MEAQYLRILGLVDFLLDLHVLLLLALLQIVDLADIGGIQLRQFDVLHEQLEVSALCWVLGDGAAIVGGVRLELPVFLEELFVDLLQSDNFLLVLMNISFVLLIVEVELADLLAETADQGLGSPQLLFLPVPEHDLEFRQQMQVDLGHRILDFEFAIKLALLVISILGLLLVV